MATSRTVDPGATYTNLVNELPQLITSLTSLRDHTSRKNAEFVAEYARILSHAKPKRMKSASLHSLHTNDNASLSTPSANPDFLQTPSSPADPVEINPFEAGNRYLYAQARDRDRRQQGRKPGSSIRSGASGPQKFRSKQMVVIYFDKHVQDTLDCMVKRLGAARNELRKAKQASALARGLQLPRLGRKYDLSTPTSSDNLLRMSKSLSGKADTTITLTSGVTPRDPHADSTFMAVDKDLEAAQTLCETAAHQFLRDGDCKIELDGSLKRLESVLIIATDVKKLLDEEKARRDQSAEKLPSDSDATLCENKKPFNSPPSMGASKLFLTMEKYMTTADVTGTDTLGLGTAEIEVDDDEGSDTSSVEIDIRQFRMARAAGIRP